MWPNPHFLSALRELHERMRAGGCTDEQKAEYQLLVGRLSDLLSAAQRLTLQPGQQARQYFRIATVWPITITVDGRTEKTSTVDLSFGGFSAILGFALAPQTRVQFGLKLPSVVERVEGQARLVGGRVVGKDLRGSFAFEPLDKIGRARLDFAIADLVLANMKL